ncbi:venom serine protease-like [Eupeodes corollae]|uniref:venom serine protease-like n=1 Tax=Eupeodes corollae TaxID=290404 RepID=UPI002491FE53|nr:venom serine protease-like [Eupeodes corollae]
MWVTTFGLVLVLQSVRITYGLFENCDNLIYVDTSRDVVYNSPGYPNKYGSGSSCRATFKTKVGYSISLKCDLLTDKGPSGCDTEKIYISQDADPSFRGAGQFCGSGHVERESEYNKISIAYVSTAAPGSGIGGKFTCTVSVRVQACDCGWSQRGRLVGGTDASPTEFPSIVGLVEKSSNSVFCGGTIISSRAVLTAAHCSQLIPGKLASNVYIIAGYTYFSSTRPTVYSSTYMIIRIIEHENYNPSTQLNDIALLITSTDIEWSRGVGPICLPLDTSSLFAYENVLLVGAGTTSFSGPRSIIVQKAAVNVIPNQPCMNYFPGLQASQLCTYANGRDACQFDSGGPVVKLGSTRQYLCGIISYGRACGGSSPGVNTRITYYITWIRNNVVASLCYKPYS